MPAGDTTLYAHWTPIIYSVSFAPGASDATGAMPATFFTYDAPRALPKNLFALNGYEFAGWRDAQGNKYADMATIVNLTNQAGADLVLYATWQPRVYDVSFVSSNNNQGTVTYTARQIAMNGFVDMTLVRATPANNSTYALRVWTYKMILDDGNTVTGETPDPAQIPIRGVTVFTAQWATVISVSYLPGEQGSWDYGANGTLFSGIDRNTPAPKFGFNGTGSGATIIPSLFDENGRPLGITAADGVTLGVRVLDWRRRQQVRHHQQHARRLRDGPPRPHHHELCLHRTLEAQGQRELQPRGRCLGSGRSSRFRDARQAHLAARGRSQHDASGLQRHHPQWLALRRLVARAGRSRLLCAGCDHHGPARESQPLRALDCASLHRCLRDRRRHLYPHPHGRDLGFHRRRAHARDARRLRLPRMAYELRARRGQLAHRPARPWHLVCRDCRHPRRNRHDHARHPLCLVHPRARRAALRGRFRFRLGLQ